METGEGGGRESSPLERERNTSERGGHGRRDELRKMKKENN